MMQSGYFQIASLGGVPVRLHWTVLLLCAWVSRLRFAPGAWVAAVLLVLFHELGHALAVRAYGFHVREVMVHGLGGHCAWSGASSPWQRSVIASGGVLAQLGLLVPAYLASRAQLGGDSEFAWDFLAVMTESNLHLIAINLMPIPPLDGAEIWKLPRLFFEGRRTRRAVETAKEARRAAAERPAAPVRTKAPADVDEAAVRDTVRRALEDAKRSSRDS